MAQKKGIELVREINDEWIAALKAEDQDLCYLMYEPFADEYWTEKYKIVFCNLEPGGWIDNGNKETLSFDTYKRLLEEKNLTIKRTSLFIYCLYNELSGNNIDEKQKKVVESDYELLMRYMKKVAYMNLLPDCGDSKYNEDWFNDFFYSKESPEKSEKDRERIKKIIEALNPDIFIVTSIGKYLIQDLYNQKFDEKHSFVYNNTLFINLGHPRTWTMKNWYESYIYKNVKLIYENLLRYNLIK
jgi:hypothetical protein